MIDNDFFWAPLPYINDNGHKMNNAGWATLDHVRTGDLFFCKSGANFEYIAVATSGMYKAERSKNRKSAKPYREGRRVDILLTKLTKPVSAQAIIDGLLATGLNACTPTVVTKKGKFWQVYASRLSQKAGEYLRSQIDYDISEHSNGGNGTPQSSLPKFYSWTVVSDDVIYKTVDDSLINDFSTGIPLDCASFFCPSEIPAGDRLDITLLINKDISLGYIRRNATERYILSLSKAATLLKLDKLKKGDTVWFERIGGQENTFCVYTMAEDSSVSVLPQQNTSSVATVNVRIGQSYFKAATSVICGYRCVVTGVADQKPSILIGSHIKPWSKSDDGERMDGHNGLLLAPHVDKLFDSYLITFSEDNKIRVSTRLQGKGDVLKAWGIDAQKKYLLTKKQQKYMEHHRAAFDALESECENRDISRIKK